MNLGDLELSIGGSVLLAELTGEIDLSNARGVEDAIIVATPNHATMVVLDLSRLDYLDSAGIQLVYELREKLQVRGQVLRLVVPTGSPAADALRLAGVMAHLDISQTVDEARGGAADVSAAESA